LRQDSDDNEPEPKVVRRGRPPTKNLKKPLGRPSLERAGSEFSDATLATGAENAILSNYDRSRNNDVYASWLADNKFERNDDLTGFSHFFTPHQF
jgi:bromodomain-containing protein 7/9